MKDVLELQQLNEGLEVEAAGIWFTTVTITIALSTISNHC